MGHNVARRDVVARQNVEAEGLNRVHLRVWKGVIAPFVALVLDFDAN